MGKVFFKIGKRNFSVPSPNKITEEQPRSSRMKTYAGTQIFKLELNTTDSLSVQCSKSLKIPQTKMASNLAFRKTHFLPLFQPYKKRSPK